MNKTLYSWTLNFTR